MLRVAGTAHPTLKETGMNYADFHRRSIESPDAF